MSWIKNGASLSEITMASYDRKRLLPLSLVLFFFYSAIGCLVPFLSLHMRDLGLTIWECAIVNTVAAVVSILGPLIFGTVAERCAKYKLMTVIAIIFSGLAYTSLLVIPRVVKLPRLPLMDFNCSAAVRLEKCSNWNVCSDAALATPNLTTFHLYQCQYICSEGRSRVNATYPINVCFRSNNGSICQIYDPLVDENATVEFESRFISWYYDEIPNVRSTEFLGEPADESPHVFNVCKYKPVSPLLVNNKKYDDMYCRPTPEGCSISCRLELRDSKGHILPSSCVEIIGDTILTFWSYLGVRVFADMCMIAAICLLDGLMVSSINDFQGLYGRTRIWPALGLIIFPPITGVLVDYYSGVAGKPDYSPPIFIFDGLVLISCAVVIALPIEAGVKGRYFVTPERPSRKKRPYACEMGILVFLVLLLGSEWGVMEAYLHNFYTDIGCSKLLIGATLSLSFLCSLPFLVLAKNMVRNIGKAHLIVFAFLFYAIRFAGISFIRLSWWVFPFESMEVFSLSVAWIGIVAYAQSLVSSSSRIKIQYVFIVLHFCGGRAVGTIIGTFLQDTFGFEWAYRGIAIFSASVGLFYLLVYHACIKPMRRRRKSLPPALVVNGNWYPLTPNRRPNGDAKVQRPIIIEQEDSDLDDGVQ